VAALADVYAAVAGAVHAAGEEQLAEADVGALRSAALRFAPLAAQRCWTAAACIAQKGVRYHWITSLACMGSQMSVV